MSATIRHELCHAKKAWSGTLIDHAFSLVNITLCPLLMVWDNCLPPSPLSPHFPLSLSLYKISGLLSTWQIPGVIAMTFRHPGSRSNARWQPLSDPVFSDSVMMSLLSLTITVAVLVSYTQTTFVQPARHRLPPIKALDRSARAEAMLLEGSNLKTSPLTLLYKATIPSQTRLTSLCTRH
jgi:hypothetical protein